jgi:uncharacterized protein YrrD
MSVVLRASDLVGLPVVSIGDGEDLAEVRDVVYDGERHRLIGFTLNKRGWIHGRMKQLLPSDAIAAIGPDAVMIEDGSCLADADEVRTELSDASPSRDVIGVRVVTSAGEDLGVVTDVIVRAGAVPEAVGYEIEHKDRAGSSAFVPITEQMAISGDALMVPETAKDDVRDDLAGFGATFGSGTPGSGGR